jgi:plasmid replication initiation protein
MTIPVLLEPTKAGFRASTGAPFSLSAEAQLAEDALKAVRLQLLAKLAAGCRIVDVGESVAAALQATERLANDPQRQQFLDAVEAYRKERDAEETGRPTISPMAQTDAAGISQ